MTPRRFVEPTGRAPLHGREEYGVSREAEALFAEIQQTAARVGGARVHARTFAKQGRGFDQVDLLLSELAHFGLVTLEQPPAPRRGLVRGEFGRADDQARGAALVAITAGNEEVRLIGGRWQRWAIG